MRGKLFEWQVRFEIWTERKREGMRHALVWHLPHWLVYWCAIRFLANATTGEFGDVHPDEVPYSIAAKRWEERRGGDPSFRKGAR